MVNDKLTADQEKKRTPRVRQVSWLGWGDGGWSFVIDSGRTFALDPEASRGRHSSM